MKYIFKKGSSHQAGVMATLQGFFPLLLGLPAYPLWYSGPSLVWKESETELEVFSVKVPPIY